MDHTVNCSSKVVVRWGGKVAFPRSPIHINPPLLQWCEDSEVVVVAASFVFTFTILLCIFPPGPWCIALWNRITGWANFTSIKDPIILVSAIRSCVGGALWRVPTLSVAIIFLTWCNYFCCRLTINVTDWLITSWPLVIISSILLLSTVSWCMHIIMTHTLINTHCNISK